MAKIKFGMMMTDASGKLGGQVFSKNRGGSYVRTKVTPSNPQSSAQMNIEGIFASISSGWSSLLESGRQSFNNLVSDYARTDIFGDLRNPSGKALYQRLNQNLMLSGQLPITDCIPPDAVPFAGIDAVDVNVNLSTYSIALLGDTTGSKLVVWATPPLSAGTSFVKNKLRVLGVFDGDEAPILDFKTEYLAKFGTIQPNANIYVGVRTINFNGQASPLETKKVNIIT